MKKVMFIVRSVVIGVEEKECKVVDGYAHVIGEYVCYKIGRGAFEDRAAAVEEIERKRQAKKASLLRQVEKLDRIVYE